MHYIFEKELLLFFLQLGCRPVEVLEALELVLLALKKTLELFVIVAVHQLGYTLVAHGPLWLLVLGLFDIGSIPKTARKFIEPVF